jgi:Zn-dependent peptidase ImmA (M78 family)
MEIEEVAARFPDSVTAERIAIWESAEELPTPTLAQLKKLSEIYRRPLAVFFLQNAPREFPVPHDFRRMPGEGFGAISPALRFELRAAQERRLSALQFYDELEEDPPAFVLTGTMREAPATLGARAREALGITIQEQFAWRNQYEAMKAWKLRVEGLGVLVFQTSGIATSEMRGFSIAENPLPVMGINRAETPRARIFSMMHELTHLMVPTSGVCDFNEDVGAPPEERRIEVYCNSVAAEILAPAEVFLAQVEIGNHPARPRVWEEETIVTLSNRFHVSREFIVRRLLEHRRCTNDFYRTKREIYHQQYLADRANTQDVRELWGKKRQRILGDAFTRLVFDTHREGHLTLSEMLGHLQIKVKHLPQFEAEFGSI